LPRVSHITSDICDSSAQPLSSFSSVDASLSATPLPRIAKATETGSKIKACGAELVVAASDLAVQDHVILNLDEHRLNPP
jgi:hypothetical protein